VATSTRFESLDTRAPAGARGTRWATVLESGFVAGAGSGFVAEGCGEPRRSRWATVLASGFVDVPVHAVR
jgi:hypothetical protein